MRRATCYSLRHSAQGRHFYPRSPCGERLIREDADFTTIQLFLSTLSLRRATNVLLHHRQQAKYFYPRSPCGERLLASQTQTQIKKFLSTLSLRRATVFKPPPFCWERDFYPRSPCGERPDFHNLNLDWILISIHALLAESDPTGTLSTADASGFLSTLSLRRATIINGKLSAMYHGHFYPRSPCGERLR